MTNFNIQFNNLELKILDVLESYNTLKQKNNDLNVAYKKNKEKIREQIKLISQIEQENKILKVANAISGNEEYKSLMKIQLNRLIKEINLSIAEIKNG